MSQLTSIQIIDTAIRTELGTHEDAEAEAFYNALGTLLSRWLIARSDYPEDASIIVPGHGSQAEIARSVREYFADVQARVRKMADGEGIEALISEVKPQLLATYPTW
jgi:hypothetical protein